MSLARVPDTSTAVEVRPTVSAVTHEHAWQTLKIGVGLEIVNVI